MTMTELLTIYVAPFVLVIGGSLMAWRNHVVMNRARARDRVADRHPGQDERWAAE